MPIYEYICKQCKRPFEAIVYGTQTAECPNCGGGDLEQKFSTYSVGLGTGWRGAQWQGVGCAASSGAS